MKYVKPNNYYKTFTLDEVRKLIAERYDHEKNGSSINRPLLIHKSFCNYSTAGCLFFALNGSPPKGYGIYVPDHEYLVIIDAWGKSRLYANVLLANDKGEKIDIDTLDNFTILEGARRK